MCNRRTQNQTGKSATFDGLSVGIFFFGCGFGIVICVGIACVLLDNIRFRMFILHCVIRNKLNMIIYFLYNFV